MSSYDVVQLYPGVPAGSEAWDWEEATSFSERWGDDVVRNVVRPSLMVVPAAASVACGTGMVVCSGGGFHGLSWNFEGKLVAEWLASRGVTCFVLKYRLVRCLTDDAPAEMESKGWEQFGKDLAPVLPLAAADGIAAVRYVRENAGRYGVEPGKVGIIGFSAGGTVAASVAFGDGGAGRPDFAAPIYPQYDWAVKAVDKPAGTMPMFIACATDDEVRLAPHSIRLYDDWVAAGQPAELHMYSEGGHGFGMRKQGLPSDGWINAFAAWMTAQGFLGK